MHDPQENRCAIQVRLRSTKSSISLKIGGARSLQFHRVQMHCDF